MSVNSYLNRKNLAPYGTVGQEGVRILVANALARWAEAVHVDVRQGWFSKSFEVEALRKHGATCKH